MFKAVLTLFLALCLTPQVQAQSLSAEGCMTIGEVLYGIVNEKAEGKTLKAQIKEMKEAITGTESEVLIPFFEQKIVEAYQSKKSAQEQGEAFIKQCFEARGDTTKLIGKKI